jgi:acyl carrier protein
MGESGLAISGPTVAMAVEAVNDVLAGRREGIDQVNASTPLDELGLDSLEVAELFAALEDRCGLELDPGSVRALLTVGDLTQLRAQLL